MMNKNDLKSGMIVMTRNGFLYIVLRSTGMNDSDVSGRDILLGITKQGKIKQTGWMNLSEYKNDLSIEDCDYDIVEVYGVNRAADIGNLKRYTIMWERE